MFLEQCLYVCVCVCMCVCAHFYVQRYLKKGLTDFAEIFTRAWVYNNLVLKEILGLGVNSKGRTPLDPKKFFPQNLKIFWGLISHNQTNSHAEYF